MITDTLCHCFDFSLYVNEVKAELEKLEEQVAEIKVRTELPRSVFALCHYSWQHVHQHFLE